MHTHTYTRVHTHTYMHVRMHTCPYIYTHIHMHIQCTFAYISMYTHAHTYAQTHTHTYAHMHAHTCTHTYSHMRAHTHNACTGTMSSMISPSHFSMLSLYKVISSAQGCWGSLHSPVSFSFSASGSKCLSYNLIFPINLQQTPLWNAVSSFLPWVLCNTKCINCILLHCHLNTDSIYSAPEQRSNSNE